MSELARRSLIGIGIAVIVAAALWLVLDHRAAEAAERAVPRAENSRAVIAQVELPVGLPRGGCSTVMLVAAMESAIATDSAPVVEIRRGGVVRVVRGAPAPVGPLEQPVWSAAVVLPCAELAALSARERAALLEVFRAWDGAGTLHAERIRSVGMRIRPAELGRLLRWLR